MCQGNCSRSADFLTRFPDFENWHDVLVDVASRHGISVADQDAWRSGYDEHEEPEDNFYAEYPELRQPAANKDRSDVVVGTPCRECPWRRNSAPGWLGNHSAGDFLALSEQGAHLPCHLHVDYEQEGWEDDASKAPQCAGHAIFLANRCKRPVGNQQAAQPDHKAVFTRPHEFVAHHTRRDPKELETVLVWDLFKL